MIETSRIAGQIERLGAWEGDFIWKMLSMDPSSGFDVFWWLFSHMSIKFTFCPNPISLFLSQWDSFPKTSTLSKCFFLENVTFLIYFTQLLLPRLVQQFTAWFLNTNYVAESVQLYDKGKNQPSNYDKLGRKPLVCSSKCAKDRQWVQWDPSQIFWLMLSRSHSNNNFSQLGLVNFVYLIGRFKRKKGMNTL